MKAGILMIVGALLFLPVVGRAVDVDAIRQSVVVPAADEQGIPDPDEVVAIPDALLDAYRQNVLDVTRSPERRMHLLVSFMFGENGLGLKYAADANYTMRDVYLHRKVNCLTFTILFVKLARLGGLEADGQMIDRLVTWGISGGMVVQSSHANAVIEIGSRKYMADIRVGELVSPVLDQKVSDDELVSLFYGNKAVDLLAQGRPEEARNWLNVAMNRDPGNASILNDAGVLEWRSGNADLAEKYFLSAVDRDPGLIGIYSNLVSFYREAGNENLAMEWSGRAAHLLAKDPYYNYSRGLFHEQGGRFVEARDAYAAAAKLKPDEPLFHMGLARVAESLGDARQAASESAVARKLLGQLKDSGYESELRSIRAMQNLFDRAPVNTTPSRNQE